MRKKITIRQRAESNNEKLYVCVLYLYLDRDSFWAGGRSHFSLLVGPRLGPVPSDMFA